MADGAWAVHSSCRALCGSGQRKSWRKRSFLSQGFAGRAVCTHTFQSRLVQSHILGGFEGAGQTQAGGEVNRARAAQQMMEAGQGKKTRFGHCSPENSPLSFRDPPYLPELPFIFQSFPFIFQRSPLSSRTPPLFFRAPLYLSELPFIFQLFCLSCFPKQSSGCFA